MSARDDPEGVENSGFKDVSAAATIDVDSVTAILGLNVRLLQDGIRIVDKTSFKPESPALAWDHLTLTGRKRILTAMPTEVHNF